MKFQIFLSFDTEITKIHEISAKFCPNFEPCSQAMDGRHPRSIQEEWLGLTATMDGCLPRYR